MAVEKTLSILKPDATSRNITGKINALIEDHGLDYYCTEKNKINRRKCR